MEDQVRVDKWLWAVRVFKTRSIATDACKKGRVTIDGQSVKPSRTLKTGEVIEVRKNPVRYSYKVKQLIQKRVGAKLVPEYMEDVTPASELEILEMQKNMSWFERERGTGRPTKKERRDIDRFKGDW
ncbi:RNA-binding S4 domain-containing protein [Prolixibacter denitrificans]|jgi:ribosome-associated heat shock protein Hsp15|uniref:Heat-shock protein Hsp15 n=1 Tax=Prolixibacter denitrificans TaxID=1541063 RepID=A0A2P8CCV7_9BACT|nr:RNA-binding S4 domain-containing protein [Prolixibacter denitrificans]PSK82800.1 ribosome-associated heat shock protein Hsp15 [Prolixibacter denitrificans]GET21385.1 heat-shock protein Hsp15 [Prolixibacter denitrificans]